MTTSLLLIVFLKKKELNVVGKTQTIIIQEVNDADDFETPPPKQVPSNKRKRGRGFQVKKKTKDQHTKSDCKGETKEQKRRIKLNTLLS
jgi:hypothetical protein